MNVAVLRPLCAHIRLNRGTNLIYDGKGVSDGVKSVLVSKVELTDDALGRLDNVQDAATIRTKEIRSEIDKRHDLLIEELNKQYNSILCGVRLDTGWDHEGC